jgi:hypothetical protein
MSRKALIYVLGTIGLGALVVTFALWHWVSTDPWRDLSFVLLAMLASMMKVRLPRTTSTMSVGFLFVLVAIVEYDFSVAVILGCPVGLLQSFWNVKRRPRFEQVLFNLATVAISGGVAYVVSHRMLRFVHAQAYLILLVLAAFIFFAADTALVAGVLCLTELRRFHDAWEKCCLWSSPYYLVGTLAAALICASIHAAGWKVSFLALPFLYLFHRHYRIAVDRLA